MTPPSIPVCVWMEKRAVASRWVSHEWAAAGVSLADDPVAHPAWVRHSGHVLSLYPDEAEGYYLNTSTGDPKVFVMWRQDEEEGGDAVPRTVTLSYNEAARLMDAQEKVDAVPMESGIRAWLEAYVAENYKPEPKKKRARNSFLTPDERSKL